MFTELQKWDEFIEGVATETIEADRLAENGPLAGKKLLNIKTEHYLLETLFIPAATPPDGGRRLLVFLASAGRQPQTNVRDVRVNFMRWSWYPAFRDWDVLCVEDPMYKLHPELRGGWYYGDRDVSLIDEVAGAVESFRRAQGAAGRDVLFVGSSAGGYAALYLCDRVRGSLCVAMSPQLILPNWAVFRQTAEILGLDLSAGDRLGRYDITRRISENTESRFVIFCALNSAGDFDNQAKPLLAAVDKELADRGTDLPGVVTARNFTFLLPKRKYPWLHSLLLEPVEVAALAGYMRRETPDPQSLAFWLRNCEIRLFHEQDYICMRFWGKAFAGLRLRNCEFPELNLNKCAIRTAAGFSAEITYIVVTNRIVFRIKSGVAASPAEMAAVLRALPNVPALGTVTAGPDHVRVDADSKNAGPLIERTLRLFEAFS